VKSINGLPYTVHQIGEDEWQVAIQNCERHPAGYSFAPVYGSRDDAQAALNEWPSHDSMQTSVVAGDDTGAAILSYIED